MASIASTNPTMIGTYRSITRRPPRSSLGSRNAGTPDSGVAVAHQYGSAASGRHEFRLPLPNMPYSFSGKVLSISWRVELVARRGRLGREAVEAFRIITMSPTGDAIDPYRQ